MIVDSNLTSDAIFLNLEDPMVSLPNSGDDDLVFPYEDNRSIRGTLLLRYVAETINVRSRLGLRLGSNPGDDVGRR